jgi:hypothetical protein
MCGSKSSKADIIPVDIVSNMMIVAAAHRANTKYVMNGVDGILKIETLEI